MGPSFSSKQSSHQTKPNNKKPASTGFKQQRICTPLAPTRNKIIYKTACSDGPNSGSGKPSQNRLRSKGPPFFFPPCAPVASARSSHLVVLVERITQMHALYPSLGVRKWSKILPYNASSEKKATRNTTEPQQQTPQQKNNPKNKPAPRTETCKVWRLQCHSIQRLWINRSCSKNNQKSRRKKTEQDQTKVDSKNTSTSNAETQDPPCQDPGDRIEEPSGIRHRSKGPP